MPAAGYGAEGSGGAERATLPRRVPVVPVEHRVAIQPALLAAAEGVGAGHREGLREGAAGRRVRRAPARGDRGFASRNSGSCSTSSGKRISFRRKFSCWKSASGRERARGCGSIGFARWTRSAARTFILTCDSCSATIRWRRSNAAVRRCKSTSIFAASSRSTRSTRSRRFRSCATRSCTSTRATCTTTCRMKSWCGATTGSTGSTRVRIFRRRTRCRSRRLRKFRLRI